MKLVRDEFEKLALEQLDMLYRIARRLTRDPSRVNARLMSYRMTGVAPDGRAFRLDGFKVIHDDRRAEIWPDTTTLFVTLTDLNGAAETVGRPSRASNKYFARSAAASELPRPTASA